MYFLDKKRVKWSEKWAVKKKITKVEKKWTNLFIKRNL